MQKITPFLWFDTQAEAAANFLRLDFRQFEDCEDRALWRGGTRTERKRNDGPIRAQWAGIHRLERWTAIQIHRSHIVLGGLQDASRSRQVLGKALRRWRTRAMRLAERQIWFVMANQSHDPWRDAE